MPEPAQNNPINIPAPTASAIQQVPAEAFSYLAALQEQLGFDSGKKSELKQRSADFWLRFWLRILIVIFVLGVNIWWSRNVLKIVYFSGSRTNSFQLSDSVLIALVSTSVATFIALVAIVAKNLFPESK